MSTAAAPTRAPVQFVPAITRLGATALVAGSMIGSGIFIVSADIQRTVRSPGLLLAVWVVTGVVTVLGAITYSELAGMFPRAGGQYVYLREGIAPLFGYLYGWTFFTVIQTGTVAAVAVAFARFTAVLFPALSPDVFLGGTITLPSGPIQIGLSPQRILAVLSIVVLTWINVRGVRMASLIQNVFTATKVAALAALVLLGLTIGRNAEAVAANFGAGFWPAGGLSFSLVPAFGAAMVGSLFAADAWYYVCFNASELKDPKRDLPFAMTVGASLVLVLYLLANVAYLSVLPADGIANAPQDRVGTAALEAMFGPVGNYLMAIAIMISCFGCNNGLLLSGARMYYAMAQDRLFFRSAARLHPVHRTPAVALMVQAVWSCVLCLSGTYSQLLDYVTFAAVLFFLFTALGLFSLRVRRPEAERPIRAYGYPWLPGLYAVFTGLLCVDLLIERPQYTWPGLAIVALGVPVYYGWRARTRQTADAAPTG